LPELEAIKELIFSMICEVPDLRSTFTELGLVQLRSRFLELLGKLGIAEIVKEVRDITLDALLYLEAPTRCIGIGYGNISSGLPRVILTI